MKFMPWIEDQAIFHYNNIPNAMSVLGAFDATKPVSLLYKKGIDAAHTTKMLEITTRDECARAGGRFVPRTFGWMAHVYLFAGDDPKTIWGENDHGSMDVHVHRAPAR